MTAAGGVPVSLTADRDGLTMLPPARYFSLLVDIPDLYGGLVGATLHRSKMFVARGNVEVELLAFGWKRDFKKLERRMLRDGRLVPGLRLRSFWAEMIAADRRAPVGAPDRGACVALARRDASRIDRVRGVMERRILDGLDGKPVRIDFVRPDGTVIVSQQHRPKPEGNGSTWSFTLVDRSGTVWRECASEKAMRQAWLDDVIGTDRSVVFADFFSLANVVADYRRPNVTVIQSIHNNHLRLGASNAPFDATQRRFLPILRDLDAFDATVFLTHRQREDVDELMGPSPQRHVIPNSIDLPDNSDVVDPLGNPEGGDRPGVGRSARWWLGRRFGRPTRQERVAATGVVVTRLVASKRVDHTIEALRLARESSGLDLRLSIFGDGVERERLAALVSSAGLSDSVRFMGHRPGAADEFFGGSFFPFTSESEGMGLTLLESMSRGCVPIAYDIRYGPRDIITDGEDGYLVADGDVAALADRIVAVAAAMPSELDRLRQSARARATEFGPAAACAGWASLVRSAMQTGVVPQPLAIETPRLAVSVYGDALQLTALLSASRPLVEPRCFVVIVGRNEAEIVRVAAVSPHISECEVQLTADVMPAHVNWMTDRFVDVFVDVYDSGAHVSIRAGAHSVPEIGSSRQEVRFVPFETKFGNLSLRRTAPTT